MIWFKIINSILLLLVFLSACARDYDRSAIAPQPDRECVSDYNPRRDYFPDKINLNYARGFTVEYHNHYKVVTVNNPWKEAEVTFQYLLVQCGTPVPTGFDRAQVIQVPVSNIIALSTTYLPHLESLELLDKLIGASDFKRINSPGVLKMIDQNQLIELGNNAKINMEVVLDMNPELVMTYGTGKNEFDSHHKLLKAGINVAINAEYMEDSPLATAEWLKFTAMFFNREAVAEKLFGEIAEEYEAIASLTRKIENRPTVFTGSSFNGVWYMPGGKSYIAQYLADAGAHYFWAEELSSGSIPLDFEAVFERAANADYWINVKQEWKRRSDIIAADDRYGEFAAIKREQVFNNNRRVNEYGGNDYWESGITNPHLVLADLIKIFYPDLLPEHEFVYYRQLE